MEDRTSSTPAGPAIPPVPSIDDSAVASTSSHDADPFTSGKVGHAAALPTGDAATMEDEYEESCWICMEPAPADPSTSPDWVQPCKCSLVAHQQCLLVWVNARQPLDREPMKCPQCQTVYKYTLPEGPSSHFAHLLEHLDDLIGVPPLIIALHAIPTAIGYSSLRLFLGADGTRILLGGKGIRSWHLGAFLVLPVLPFGLWFYELKSLNRRSHLLRRSNIPYLVFPWLPLALAGRYMNGPRAGLLKVDGKWPPGPVVTLAGLQLLNIIYPLVRKRINTLIFSTPLSSTLPFPVGGGGGGTTANDPNAFVFPFAGDADGDVDDVDAMNQNLPARSILWKLAKPLMNGILNPIVGWGVGVGLRLYFSRGGGSSWGKRLLGVGGGGGVGRSELRGGGGGGGWWLRSSRDDTWRGRVRPDWWYCAVGGCLIAVIRDSCRLTARYIRVRQMRSRTVTNYSESQIKNDKETMDMMLRAIQDLNVEELRLLAENVREVEAAEAAAAAAAAAAEEGEGEGDEEEGGDDDDDEGEIVVVQVPA